MHITEKFKSTKFGGILRFIRPAAPLWLTAILVVFSLYYTFLADLHVKYIFEKHASQLHGTQVTVHSAHLGLLEGKLELKDIQVAHPTAATRNLYEVGSLEGKFLLAPLFRKQLVFQKVNLSGVKYFSPRQPTEEPFDLHLFQTSIPVFETFSSNLFATLNAGLSKNPLKHLAQLSTGLHTRELIDERMPRLASTLSLEQVQRELAHAEHEVELAYTTNKDDLENLNIAKDKIETTQNSARAQLDALNKEIEKDTTEIKKNLGLPEGDVESLAPIIFGPKALYFLEQIGQWVEFSRRKMPIKSGPVGKSYVLQERERGTSVHFPYLAGNPTLLVYELNIESKDNKVETTGFVEGKVTNLTTDPYILGKPTTGSLKLAFPSQGLNGVNLNFTIDHVGDEPKEQIDLEIDQLVLKNSEICKTSDMALNISKGEGALKVSASFEPKSLKAEGHFKSNSTEFKVISRYKKMEEYLQTLLLPFYQFELTANIEGPMDALKLDLDSSLDSKLTAGLNDEIRRQLSAVDAAIKNELLDHAMPKKHAFIERLDKLKREALPNINTQIHRLKTRPATKRTTQNEHLFELSELQ